MRSLEENTLLAVVGPTASGKSNLAIMLAEELGGELICTDSMQVYRRMNIGTAKPTPEEQKRVIHHQIDLVNPDEHYSVGKYIRDATPIIEKLLEEKKTIILVGGTGLYYRGLIFGICDIPDTPVYIQEKINSWHKNGILFCYEKLKELDPQASEKLHPNDTTRILRALEVFLTTGNSILKYQKDCPFHQKIRYPVLSIGYQFDRSVLYERINSRTITMLEKGWIDEVENLLHSYPPNLKSFRSIGYRQIISFLQNEISKSEMIEKIQQKTRNYAKRQLTWFKKEPDINWFSPGKEKEILEFVKNTLG